MKIKDLHHGVIPAVLIVALVLGGLISNLNQSRDYLYWFLIQVGMLPDEQTSDEQESPSLETQGDSTAATNQPSKRKNQHPEWEPISPVIDTMETHWNRPANLSAEQRSKFASKLQEYLTQPDSLWSYYGSTYNKRESEEFPTPGIPPTLKKKSLSYTQVLKAKERISALIARPPDDPKKRELVSEIQELWNRITERHEKTYIEGSSRMSPQMRDGAHAQNMETAQDHLLKGKLTLRDLARVDSAISYVHQTRRFFELQRDDIRTLLSNLEKTQDYTPEAPIESLLPPGSPPLDKYTSQLDPQYAKANKELERRRRPPLPPTTSIKSEYYLIQYARDLSDFVNHKQISIYDLRRAFPSLRWAEEVEAIEAEYAYQNDRTGHPEKISLKADLLTCYPMPPQMQGQPDPAPLIRRAIDSLFSLPRYTDQEE